jgi:regulator of replication initiation timing
LREGKIMAEYESDPELEDLYHEHDRLKAENERLRKALEECIDALSDHVQKEAKEKDVDLAELCPCWDDTLVKARAALKREGE